MLDFSNQFPFLTTISKRTKLQLAKELWIARIWMRNFVAYGTDRNFVGYGTDSKPPVENEKLALSGRKRGDLIIPKISRSQSVQA